MYLFIFIYIHLFLFIKHIPYLASAGSAINSAKKRDKREGMKKKRIAAEGEATHPLPGDWCTYREGIKEGRAKEGYRERASNLDMWTTWSPLTTRMHHTVGLF